jgi:hypothetical protein
MFDDLSKRQLKQLETVWNTALKSVHCRESLRDEISRALATGCTREHRRDRIRRRGRQAAATQAATGVQWPAPTDPHAPGQEQLYR